MVSIDDYTPGERIEANAKLMGAVFDKIVEFQCELGLEVRSKVVQWCCLLTLIEQKIESHFCEVYAVVCVMETKRKLEKEWNSEFHQQVETGITPCDWLDRCI